MLEQTELFKVIVKVDAQMQIFEIEINQDVVTTKNPTQVKQFCLYVCDLSIPALTEVATSI